ncbi:unnamed protein product [Leptidea sinapis]|uniref:Uncharacterized protein n=1 Tax=Leptidea sinapis TaxID=189913 RepID=A0A5E4Q405_9NEOP|nr:unnamed protein product [Leptidea sinapis]
MEARGEVPAPRYAHSAILFGHDIIMYGGVLVSDLPDRGIGACGQDKETSNVSILRAFTSLRIPSFSTGMMLVFGGNTHNDSAVTTVSSPANAKCFSSQAMLYDIRFDGRLRSDALLFQVGDRCSSRTDEVSCLTSSQDSAVACVWKVQAGICVGVSTLTQL